MGKRGETSLSQGREKLCLKREKALKFKEFTIWQTFLKVIHVAAWLLPNACPRYSDRPDRPFWPFPRENEDVLGLRVASCRQGEHVQQLFPGKGF